MKRWGLLVAGLYLLVLVSLTAPVTTLAFVDDYISSGDLGPSARRVASQFVDTFEVFKFWWYWAVVGALFLAQLAFVLVPIRAGPARPKSRIPVLARLCAYLITGSILELLVAVPTHVVARVRGYCCAGFGTFVGIAAGLAVLLFAFGPAVLLLYERRYRKIMEGR